MEYKIGDAVEFIYKRVIGEGDIVKVRYGLSFFCKKTPSKFSRRQI